MYDLKASVAGTEKRIAGGIGFGLLLAVFGWITFHELSQLEAGAVESIQVLEPIAWMYDAFGFWGAVAIFPVGVTFCLWMAVSAWQERKVLQRRVGKKALIQAIRSEHNKGGRFVRGTEEDGALPRSTIILGVLLIASLVGAFLAVKLGYFH